MLQLIFARALRPLDLMDLIALDLLLLWILLPWIFALDLYATYPLGLRCIRVNGWWPDLWRQAV